MGVALALGFVILAPARAADGPVTPSAERPRLVVLTDYFKDPDEVQSMIRLLCYANELEFEGFVATSLAFGGGEVRPDLLVDLFDAYAKVQPNLQKHARPGFPFPTAEALKRIVFPGAPMIRKLVGQGKGFPVPYPAGARDSRSCEPAENWLDRRKISPGAEHLVRVVDREDPRPVWVSIWGGAIDLAQAIWKVRQTRPPAAAARFIGKLRVHQSNWQDTGTVWIWHHVPELFFIVTNQAKGGLNTECDESLRNEAWLRRHVLEGHGPLAARYPVLTEKGTKLAMKEGDSPTFLSLLAPGLSDPEQPEWGGWGGRRERLDPKRNFFVDGRDRHPASAEPQREMYWTLARWAGAISRDFEARLDWCVREPAAANHPPVARLGGDATRQVLRRSVRAGQVVSLDAASSNDPDGDALDFRWSHYAEPGTLRIPLELRGADSAQATFVAPAVSQPQTAHLVLAVTDRGEPKLTSYRRLILTIEPAAAVRKEP